jgi:hypothetical protein
MQKYLGNFLQCTKVRQLSRGKVLTSVFELQKLLQLFFKDNNKASLSESLKETKWLLKLADMYQPLSTFNISMQGPKEGIITSTDILLALLENNFLVNNLAAIQLCSPL